MRSASAAASPGWPPPTRKGVPHLVPVCYAIVGDSLYITIDEKPKRTDIPLKRLRNIAENPEIAVTVDRWDEDWRRLAWVMLRGRAEILADGEEHDRAQARLRERYPQYREHGPRAVAGDRLAHRARVGLGRSGRLSRERSTNGHASCPDGA